MRTLRYNTIKLKDFRHSDESRNPFRAIMDSRACAERSRSMRGNDANLNGIDPMLKNV